MKPEADSIDWSVVHRTHEVNEVPDPKAAQERFWKQRLHNLKQVTMEAAIRTDLSIEYNKQLRLCKN